MVDPSPTEQDRRDHLQTLERGLAVITAFTGRGSRLSISEIAAATDLPRPVVRRILLTLERLGYARSEGSRHALTPRVLSLGYAYLSALDITEVAQPLMESLTDELDVGTSLAALDGDDVVYLHRVQRNRITSINLAVGTRLPAHATSMGHVLLAALSPSALGSYLAAAPLRPLTDRTVTEPDALRERLALVRRRGWDVVDQELEAGRRSAAAPVRDASGQVVAALALSCGTVERTVAQLETELVTPLVATASRISEHLGGRGGGYAEQRG